MKTLLLLFCLVSGTLMAQHTKATPLMSRDVTEFNDKQGLLFEVEYSPGGSDPIHRLNGHAFIYVLKGTVEMHVAGKEPVTLTRGQTFYEGPNDVHLVGRNTSNTKPAKFLVFFIQDKDAPILTPVVPANMIPN